MVVVAHPSTSKSHTAGYVPKSRTNVLGSSGNTTTVHPAASLRPISGPASVEPVTSSLDEASTFKLNRQFHPFCYPRPLAPLLLPSSVRPHHLSEVP